MDMGTHIRILRFSIFSSLLPFFFTACLDLEASAITVAKIANIVKRRKQSLVSIWCTRGDTNRSLLFPIPNRGSLSFEHGTEPEIGYLNDGTNSFLHIISHGIL